jgi:general secretion pathway protein A
MVDEALGLAAPDDLYINLHIQEVLATLRYGIEARKGLIVLTGESGSGKTTLLQKLRADLTANVICVKACDPRAGMTDIARLLLDRLGGETSQDSATLLHQAKLTLRARLDQRQIVALILDNAHHFSDLVLAGITQNFLGGSAEAPHHSSLQVVLSGRPELRQKLAHAALVPLRRYRPLICELRPLSSSEVGSFIFHGLRRRQRSEQLFDERSVKRVALYASGNPGALKALYERSLQLSDNRTVTPELVDQASRDLNLSASRVPPFGETASFDQPIDRPPRVRRPLFDEPPENSGRKPALGLEADRRLLDSDVEPSFPRYATQDQYRPRSRRRVAVLALVVSMVGAVAMISSSGGIARIADWTQQFSMKQPDQPVRTAVLPESSESSINAQPIPVPGPDFPSIPAPNPALPDDDSPRAEQTQATVERGPAEEPASLEQSKPIKPTPQDAQPKNAENRNLATQVVKAIESRAIMGVEVSVVHGTAYLHGRVATERQRRAAERAARTVVGVERVQNRIAINYG